VPGLIAFLATAVSSAVSTGLLVITATVLMVESMRRSEPAAPNVDLAFYLLMGGTLAGVVVAAIAAWWLLEPVGSAYRRGGLAMVSAFATVLLMLVCIPLHHLFGRAGLLVLLGLWGVAAVILARRARRLGAVT
jgi:hypothetical protein